MKVICIFFFSATSGTTEEKLLSNYDYVLCKREKASKHHLPNYMQVDSSKEILSHMVQVPLKQYVYQQWAISRLLNKHWKVSFHSTSLPDFLSVRVFLKIHFFLPPNFPPWAQSTFPQKGIQWKSLTFFLTTCTAKKENICYFRNTSFSSVNGSYTSAF